MGIAAGGVHSALHSWSTIQLANGWSSTSPSSSSTKKFYNEWADGKQTLPRPLYGWSGMSPVGACWWPNTAGSVVPPAVPRSCKAQGMPKMVPLHPSPHPIQWCSFVTLGYPDIELENISHPPCAPERDPWTSTLVEGAKFNCSLFIFLLLFYKLLLGILMCVFHFSLE